MILLDIFEQKEAHVKAIDALAQRRDEQLKEYIKNLKIALAQVRDAEQRQAIQDRIGQYEKERVDLSLGRTIHEVERPQQPPAKGLLKNKDLVTPQQRVAGATPAKPGLAGAVKDVVGGIKRFVKGEPDQGPTYEDQELDEQTAPSKPFELTAQEPQSQGQAVYQQLIQAYKAEVPYVIIPFMADEKQATLTKPSIFNALVALYKMNPNKRKSTIEKSFADFESFMLFVSRLKPYVYRKPKPEDKASLQQQTTPSPSPTPPAQTAPTATTATTTPTQSATGQATRWEPFKDLNERKSQKKKSKDPEFGDVEVVRALQQLRAKHPSARSDVEALARDEIDHQKRSDQQLAAIQGANTKQDALLRQLVALDREQGKEITGLDAELARVQATNDQLQKTIQGITGAKKASGAKKTAAPEQPATVSTVPVEVPADSADSDEIARLNQEIQDLKAVAQTAPTEKEKTTAAKRINILYQQYLEKQQAIRKGARTRATQKAQQAMAEPLEKELGGKRFKPVSPKAKIVPPKNLGRRKTDIEAPPIPVAYQEPDEFDLGAMFKGMPLKSASRSRAAIHEGRMKQALDDYKMARDDEFYNKYKITKRDFYRTVVNPKVTTKKTAYQAPQTCPQCSQSHERCVCEGTAQQFGQAVRMAGHTGRELEQDPETHKEIVRTKQQLDKRKEYMARSAAGYGDEPEDYRDVDETFDMPGMTVPRKSVIQGYTVYFNPSTKTVSVTRGGDSEEAAIEQARIGTVNMKTFKQAAERMIDRIEELAESQDPATKQEYDRAVDSVNSQLRFEKNEAVRQMLQARLKVLQDKGKVHGWHKDTIIREDTAALAAEDAILKRIFVRHRDLMLEYGPDKITQAAESVAYNVGDIAHITDEQITEWVGQVEYILGARP